MARATPRGDSPPISAEIEVTRGSATLIAAALTLPIFNSFPAENALEGVKRDSYMPDGAGCNALQEARRRL